MDAWRGLEIEDDVLQSFLKKFDSSSSLIPGPTGNIQAAMLNRISDDPRTTQQFAEEVAQATFERDFNSNAWKWAEMYIKHHDIVKDGDINNVTHLGTAKPFETLHIAVCLVKECIPNGLGDMKLNLKDTTGSMKASLHNKVLSDPKFGPHIDVGCVMILNHVTHLNHVHSISTVSHISHTYSYYLLLFIYVTTFTAYPPNIYLNIVLTNVINVFAADICPPTKELVMVTPKPVIRPLKVDPPNIAEIMRKLRNPFLQIPSSSKPTDNNNNKDTSNTME
ncbi:hypothetical protein V8G54_032087 [Vigna mungo]|uniref:Homologous recombination OB-fold protein OB-fold domain-containing protein n=1 Tax=Vigna mungo TaxID=3915 RepID=A0AAQ3MMA2_VIGMU